MPEQGKGPSVGASHPGGEILEQVPGALWATDAALIVTSVSGGLLETLQVPARNIVGRPVAELFRRFGAELAATSLHRRALSREAGRFDFESPAGVFEARIAPLLSDGEVVGSVGLAVDVSDTRKMQDQMRTAQRMESIGRLAGGIAHDFNNVLAIIESCGALLAGQVHEAGALEDIDLIRSATAKAKDMVAHLLAFSRRPVAKAEPLDLRAVVADLSRLLSRVLGERVRLQVQPGEGSLGSIVADRSQVEQILMNLVVNARDAMPRGGDITIRCKNMSIDAAESARHIGATPGPYVMVSVTDTGSGMDRATQERIFEPFFSTKAPGRGTGLGLATVYGIVKQSGGFLTVDSQLGRGTTFRIYFPRVDEPLTKPPTPLPSITSIGGTETVLLVEDDEDLRRATRRILKSRGYTVLEAGNGGEALLLCERFTGEIHLLLTDVVMPQMTARELVSKLGEVRPDMSVVFMSGYADGAAVEEGLVDADANFLNKPFSPQTLLDAIRRAIERA